MTWLTWLIVALLIAVVAAVTGLKPAGTRPVSRTRLMGVARVVLILLAAVAAYLMFASRP